MQSPNSSACSSSAYRANNTSTHLDNDNLRLLLSRSTRCALSSFLDQFELLVHSSAQAEVKRKLKSDIKVLIWDLANLNLKDLPSKRKSVPNEVFYEITEALSIELIGHLVRVQNWTIDRDEQREGRISGMMNENNRLKHSLVDLKLESAGSSFAPDHFADNLNVSSKDDQSTTRKDNDAQTQECKTNRFEFKDDIDILTGMSHLYDFSRLRGLFKTEKEISPQASGHSDLESSSQSNATNFSQEPPPQYRFDKYLDDGINYWPHTEHDPDDMKNWIKRNYMQQLGMKIVIRSFYSSYLNFFRKCEYKFPIRAVGRCVREVFPFITTCNSGCYKRGTYTSLYKDLSKRVD